MENNINLNLVDHVDDNTDSDQVVAVQTQTLPTTQPTISTFLNPINRQRNNNLRISDIINNSRSGRRSRDAWRRSLSGSNLITDITEDPVEKFEDNLGTFTSESELFTTSAQGYNIYNRISSQIDMKLNDFFKKMNNDSLTTDFESALNKHIKFDELSVDVECDAQITKELGISLTEFEIYVSKYKELLNKYFKNVLEKEKKIKSTLRKLHNLNKWVKRVQSFNLLDDEDDESSEPSIPIASLNRQTSNTKLPSVQETQSTPSTAELRLLSGIQDYVSEKVQDLDALKLRREHEISRCSFTKLVDIGHKINNIHQNQLCTICLTNAVSICLIPCGHSCCEGCYNSYNEGSNSNRRRICFVCRGTVSKTQKIYFTS